MDRGGVVVVTGATGFIGPWVVRHLELAGARVHVAARAKSARIPALQSAASVVHAVDLTRADAVTDLFEQVQPAITFNLAAYGVDRAQRSRERAFLINDALPGEVARAALGSPTRSWHGQRSRRQT